MDDLRGAASEALRQLAWCVQNDPCTALGTRTHHGWDGRLVGYEWRGQGYAETCDALAPIQRMGSELAEMITPGTRPRRTAAPAARYAKLVFQWGRVRPRRWSPRAVVDVVGWAIRKASEPQFGFGAAWSKVGALATTHLEDCQGGRPHAIADSRVTASLILRLDAALAQRGGGEVRCVFPGLALMPRRGERGELAKHKLCPTRPAFRRRWDTQTMVSRLVLCLRDILNGRARLPRMPLPGGGCGAWTTRGVEMVLFMDGA